MFEIITGEFWYLFPFAICVATLANYIGIGGATFFAPFFMIVLDLDANVAIAVAIITELFGFSSGVSGYFFRGLYDARIVLYGIAAAIPCAIIGANISHHIDQFLLSVLFINGLAIMAIAFIVKHHTAPCDHAATEEDYDDMDVPLKTIYTHAKEKLTYPVANMKVGATMMGVGGFLVGLLSTGLGELNAFFMIRMSRLPTKIATGTSVFIIAITVLTASITHFFSLLSMGDETYTLFLNIVIFTVPGVIIGGQLGPYFADRLKVKNFELYLGFIFLFIAVIELVELMLD